MRTEVLQQFGDNRSVVTSSTIPHSTLGKQWNALSYHRVREAIAGGWLCFEHIPGTANPADILMKPLPWATMREYVEPLLFWKGEMNVPSGSQNPEGSDMNPVRDYTRDLSLVADGGHGGNPPVMLRLWNNRYAVLVDVDDDDGGKTPADFTWETEVPKFSC